jgi:hypothetical protein
MADNDVEIDLTEHSSEEKEEEEEVDKTECYICLGTDGPFVRPCSNTRCTIRGHKECIAKQAQKTNDKCPCSTKFVSTSKVDRKRCWSLCCHRFIKVFLHLFIMIGGSIATVLMALGKTVVNPWIQCGPRYEVHPCDDGAVGTIFFTFLFFPLFWQFHCRCNPNVDKCCRYHIFKCDDLKDRMIFKSKLTMFIMLLGANLLVIFAHLIGYFPIKYYFHKDDFFTWRTSLAGFIIYAMIIALLLLALAIWCIYKCIEDSAIQNYGVTEYGVAVDTSEDLPEDTPLVV